MLLVIYSFYNSDTNYNVCTFWEWADLSAYHNLGGNTTNIGLYNREIIYLSKRKNPDMQLINEKSVGNNSKKYWIAHN